MSDARPKTSLDLNLVQVVAGTGAALTAALLGSLFGIAGTLLGTAVGSTVATVCTAVYTYQLRRTHDRLQRSDSSPAGWLRPTALRTLPWFRVLAAAAMVFGLALAALTVIESMLGRPLSSATGGLHARAGGSTSVGHVLPPDLRDHLPTPRLVSPTTPAVLVPERSSPLPATRWGTPGTPGSTHPPDQGAPIAPPPDVASTMPSAAPTAAPTPSVTTGSEIPPPSVDPSSIDQPTASPSSDLQP
jgi:hypothetical protein